MKKLDGLVHRWHIVATRVVYGGHGGWWDKGDVYCGTITQGEAAAIANALCSVREHKDAWVVKEIPNEQREPAVQT